MVYIFLIMIVKNESKIIKRCLESTLGVIDGMCILDTGSTDNTKEIIEEFLSSHSDQIKGKVECEKFTNFGETRTRSFILAKQYLKEHTNWDERETYGLLLDADHILKTERFSKNLLGEFDEYRVKQIDSICQYFNTRLIRMSENWVCLGRTHEVWSIKNLNKTGIHSINVIQDEKLFWIDDVTDGGCKEDKLERDERLLLQGLEEDPQIMYAIHLHSRYYFYLAQTYHAMKKYKKSIECYKRRLEQSDDFEEEKWLSKFMIIKNYVGLQKEENTEKYYDEIKSLALEAYNFRSSRIESLQFACEESVRLRKFEDAKMFLDIARTITTIPEKDLLSVNKDIYNFGNDLLQYAMESARQTETPYFFSSLALQILNKLPLARIQLEQFFIQEVVKNAPIISVDRKPLFVGNDFSSLSIASTDTGFTLLINNTLFHLSPDFFPLTCHTSQDDVVRNNQVIIYDGEKMFIPTLGMFSSDLNFKEKEIDPKWKVNPNTISLVNKYCFLTSLFPWKLNNEEVTQTKAVPKFLKYFIPIYVAVSINEHEKIILCVAHFGTHQPEKTLLAFVYIDKNGNYLRNSFPFTFCKDHPIGVHSFTINQLNKKAVVIYSTHDFIPRLVEFTIPE